MFASNPTTSKMRCIPPVLLGCLLSLTACSSDRLTYFDTKQGYIVLQKGQTLVADRDMTLATESVVQEKDEQILDLIRVNQQLLRRQDFKGTR